MGTMEKDDKIKSSEARNKQFVMVVILTLAAACGLYSLYFRPSVIRSQLEKMEAAIVVSNDLLQIDPPRNLEELETRYRSLEAEVRQIKATGIIMETDPHSLQKISELQDAAREFIKAKYGDFPSHQSAYQVKVDLEFPPSVPDYEKNGKYGSITIALAPIDLIPVSVFTFLEEARTWIHGSFHRNAGHVLQVQAVSAVKKHLPFQEYSSKFPHKKGTTGYCGRPSGPCWYVSIMDNTRNHGPGSQGSKNPHEADANFGTVIEGFDDIVPRIHSIPQREWLDKKNEVQITKMKILIPEKLDGTGGYKPWKDPYHDPETTLTD